MLPGFVLTQRFGLQSNLLAPLNEQVSNIVLAYVGQDPYESTHSTFRHAGDLLVRVDSLDHCRRMTLSHDGQVRFEDCLTEDSEDKVVERFVRNFRTLDVIAKTAQSKFKPDVDVHISGENKAVENAYLLFYGNCPTIERKVDEEFRDLNLEVAKETQMEHPKGQEGCMAIVHVRFNPNYTCEQAGVR